MLAKLYQFYSIYNNIWYYQVLKIFFKLIDMIYISLIVRAVVHFIFIGHLYFIFSEVTHWILSWFSYCVVFFWWTYMSLLYILDSNPLSVICVTDIFSCFLVLIICILILLMVCFMNRNLKFWYYQIFHIFFICFIFCLRCSFFLG